LTGAPCRHRILLTQYNKAVTLVSSDGAAATVIDGRLSAQPTNVLIMTDGGQFGKPEHGFTVTSTGHSGLSKGIVIDSTNVKIQGNQVVGTPVPFGSFVPDVGIYTVPTMATAPVVIKGNQVIGWRTGIEAHGPGRTVKGNVSVLNDTGIFANTTGKIARNVVIANGAVGLEIINVVAGAVGNAVLGNYGDGLEVGIGTGVSGPLELNNIFGNAIAGNGACGAGNFGVVGLAATDNYWGAATGPGLDPADDLCNLGVGTTTVTPFALDPFPLSAPIKPSACGC